MIFRKSAKSFLFAGIAAIGALTAVGPAAYGAGAGYSQFFLPGDEDLLAYVLRDLRNEGTVGTTMHSLVAVTAWASDTIVIVDHWEDGYEYDPADPTSSFDEMFTLSAAGQAKLFEDSSIPLGRTVNPDPAFCNASAPEADDSVCVVDGRDIIYIIGTSATITRGTWLQTGDTFQALAWEVYPVRPQLIKYVLPFGEELNASGLNDFERVYGLIQATSDNTVLQIDFGGDNVYDSFDHNYDGTLDGTQLILNKGDVYLLDRRSDGPGGTLNTGTTILGSQTLQVQYIIGDQGSQWEVRGLSAFPRGFWDKEYYAPVDETTGGTVTDIYLYNPHDTDLTINWETNAGSGSFVIGTTTRTVSFNAQAGASIPQNGAVYLSGSDVFWGVSSIDAEGTNNDWAYSLVPRALLDSEYFLGWAPAYSFSLLPFNAANPEPDASGLFITAVQDNTTVFVDEDVDGTPDQTISLDRLETAYVTSSLAPPALLDHDLSRARIYATGPYAMAYGQNPDNVAGGYAAALDLGYTVLPTTDRWFDLVLDVNKSASPSVLPANSIGEQTTFTVQAYTLAYSVDGLTLVDALPAGFEYVAGSTVITLPDNTTVSGGTADDGNATGATTLTWSGSDVFGAYANLAPNQAISISFLARTTAATFNEGALATNNVTATGTRTVQGIEQVFTATDFAFVAFSNSSMAITKTSDVDPVAYPGDTITYTVNITNDGAAPLSNISVYDALPDGVTYGSGTVVFPQVPGTFTNADSFTVASYSNSNGTAPWATSWVETNDNGSPTNGKIDIETGNSRLTFRGTSTTDTFSIERTIDLTGKTNRSLVFGYAEQGTLEPEDVMTVTVNGVTVLTTSDDFGSGTYNNTVALEGIIASTSPVVTIRFEAVGFSGGNTTPEFWYLNDITFQFDRGVVGTAAVNPAPGLISSGDGYALAVGESLVITVTATVDNPLATSITQLTNQACATSTQISLPQCAEVTDPVLNPSAEAGEVGDLIWLDIDGDGIKDPGEPGLSNVQVTLKDEFGTPVAVVFTDANGGYRFSGVLPGNGYFVEITDGLAPGLIQTAPAGHSDFRSDPFDLAPGQTFLDADLGFKTPAGTGTIGDYVWQDSNANGIQDPGELGLGGVTVLLYRDVNANGTLEPGTTATSSFACTGVPAGIPDNTPAGVSATVTAAAVPGVITGVTVDVDASHPWVGDLIFTLTSPASTAITLLDRPGVPASGNGCNNDNVVVSFADGSPDPENTCAGGGGTPWPVSQAGPVTPLASLIGENANGNWTLNVSDNSGADTGTLNSCQLVIESATGADGGPIAAVVTNADGSYHFFGVDATDGAGTDDYFVVVNSSQPALTGYAATTFPQTSVADLGANEARLSNDFGFFANASPRYAYRDRVWFDPNEDQQDDGETGIAGVTVNLLDDARQVVATVTTDASGYFDFTGLEGSTFYYIEISDTGGVLSDYFGTTAEAVAGEQQISNLTGDVDFTVEPTEPNFGYNAYGAVGDTVYNDLDGDGTQDPGEVGIAGVTVQLYNDANGNGVVDGGDAVIRTLVSDSSGNYLFAGIANGDYIVSVGTPPAGYTFTGSDSDGGTGGQQLQATVTAGGADLGADFGYQVTSNPRTLSGTLWNDANNNGTLDDVGRFANVTVELRNSGGTLIGITTTNASGIYSFAGLPAVADYQLRVTDTNGVLNGYQTTFEVTEGALNGPYNALETVDLSGGSASNINFGYYRPPVVPLAVSLSSFHAERGGRGTTFEWTTDNEVGNLGFYLLGEVNDEWVDISSDLIPSKVIDSSTRQHYSYESDRVDADSFLLVDVDVSGKARYHGPFRLGASEVSDPPSQLQIDWVGVRAEHETKVAARRAGVLSRGTPTAARLLIEAEGLYRISYEVLAASGFDFAGTPVTSMGLFDRNGAVPMAVVPNAATFGPGMAIEFFGADSNSLYNKRNHYTLRTDRVGVLAEIDGTAPSGSPQTTYQETTKIESDLKYTFGSPNGDPWYDTWVQAISGPATLNRSIAIEDLVPGAGNARLSLGLWGVTYWPAAPDHRVKASLNGVELVDETFDGHTTWNHEVALDPALLDTGGDAVLQLQLPRDLPGVVYDIVAVDDYSITYPRRLTTRSATPDRLYFSHPGAGSYRVDGFDSDNIVVYRREGGRLQRLTGSSAVWNGTSYEITFKGGRAADYFVQVGSTMLQPAIVPVPSPVELGAGPAKYLVIAHPDFIDGVQPLVNYRMGQGYSADVVDVEAIYERYSNGMVDPEAIRTYIAEAVANRATGYVLLVGGDSYDYRDRLGFGSLSFIPSLYAATDELINHAPVDPLFGDIDRDGTVDVPVGRLPVRTSGELAGIIAKVQEFESKDYEKTMLAATDKYDADQGVSFKSLSDQLLQPLAGSWTITHADVETMGLAAAKQKVKDTLNEGSAYAQYFGHSSQTLWSFDRLLQASDVGNLLNQGRPALVAQWGCWNNYVVDPQVSTMGSALLTTQDRGAAAVLGASTWTSTASDLALGNYFLPRVAQPGWAVGDVLVSSKRSLASAQPGQHQSVQWGWTLLGDPLLVLQPLAPGSCLGNPATGDDDGDRICDDIDVCIGSDQIGDIDHDGVCHDRDLCVGFPDSADADGDGVPDGCDLCLGDDSLGDPDGDGICGAPEGNIFFDGFESGNTTE